MWIRKAFLYTFVWLNNQSKACLTISFASECGHFDVSILCKYSSRTHVRLGAWFWSAKADIFFSESLHILAERLSQSEIELPLRKICYYSPLAEVGVSTQTEMNYIRWKAMAHYCHFWEMFVSVNPWRTDAVKEPAEPAMCWWTEWQWKPVFRHCPWWMEDQFWQ